MSIPYHISSLADTFLQMHLSYISTVFIYHYRIASELQEATTDHNHQCKIMSNVATTSVGLHQLNHLIVLYTGDWSAHGTVSLPKK